MIKIAVIGIAGESVFLSVDAFAKTGETVVVNSYHNELGGKGFNQAVAAARFGAKVSFLSAVYKGDVDEYSKISKDNGIIPFFIPKDERSPYAVITTDEKGDNKVLVYRGASLSKNDVEPFKDEIESADVLLITNEVPFEVNERAVEIAKAKNVKVILNPAPAKNNPKDFLDRIDLFTPNEHETDGLENYDNVVITQGEKGVFIKRTGETITAVNAEKVVDTTGAGDTFNGVFAVLIAERNNVESACRKANLAASIKVGRKYILSSIPCREEIENHKE